ncbi:PEP-CTERM protein-sorting domain-containing protein [Terrimicrobium sacchariphilum]|uniref:PEP-CTERM protein-sorting domain-containing protein n=1 Tax=Terrimicrobium sacchariphilum TaxID=690879 RepID=A0A146G4E3_TERSA|nr:hypothetical protein [Terrimicrobium sacchariphilum]GAT31897.1 PEP-CTERM protein-sorting domain-containing protein [Terrimicrobium sacchariphilum]
MKTAISQLLLAAVVAGLAPSITAHATLLAYEGFTGYAAGQQLAGKPVGSSAYGVSGTVGGIGQSNDYYASANGLTFGSMPVSAGSAMYADNAGVAAGLTYNYNGPSVTGTVYTSFLLNIASGITTASSSGLRINTSQNASGATAFFQSYGDTSSSTVPGNAYGLNASQVNSSSPATTAGSLSLNTTYLVVGIFTNTGTSLSAGSPGLGTTYVMTLDQYNYFNSHGGVTTAALAAATVGASGGNTIFSAVSSSVTSGTYTLQTGGGIQFAIGNAQVSQTVYFDEMRVGTSLSDVIPVPEPSSVSLVIAGISFLVLRGISARRRSLR